MGRAVCLRNIAMFSLTIHDEVSFSAYGVLIADESGLSAAFSMIKEQYRSGFLQKAEKMIKNRKERAKSRNSNKSITDDKPEKILYGSNPEKLNKYHWVPALSLAKLCALYRSSVNNMLDSKLLDDVGVLFLFALFTRSRRVSANP